MVDLYCERISSDIWAEPVNALTNTAFIVAALAVWLLAHQWQKLSTGTWILIGLMAAVGTGSTLFHAYATKLGQSSRCDTNITLPNPISVVV